MSYLPYESKTYKEPQKPFFDEEQSLTVFFNNLEPASSVISDKAHSPQSMLKLYKYLPHPLPYLPGPSILDEVLENELRNEINRNNRSLIKAESGILPNLTSSEEIKEETNPEAVPDSAKDMSSFNLKRPLSKKHLKGNKAHASKKNNSSKNTEKKALKSDSSVHMYISGVDISESFRAAQLPKYSGSDDEYKDDAESIKQELSPNVSSPLSYSTLKQTLSEVAKLEGKEKEYINKCVQCTIFGCSEKIFVIPHSLSSLLRTMAFLLHELNKESSVVYGSKEKKSLMPAIHIALSDLCNQKTDNQFCFDTTYSDSKRVEKILGDLQKYIKDVYGDKGERNEKLENLKKIYIDFKKKEVEIGVLKEKLEQNENNHWDEIEIKESEFKNPEVTLQNKRLECEQLLAQVEFSSRELNQCIQSLAELDWDIKKTQEQVNNLKKSVTSKSRGEMLGKKMSFHKISNEGLTKTIKNKETELGKKKN